MKKWYAVIGDPINQSMSPICMMIGLMKMSLMHRIFQSM